MALLLGEIVRRQARHRPERSAYVIGPERVTYRRLNAMANRLAHALRALGVGRGDRVATLAENRVEYPAIYFALAKLGAIHVPVNFRYRASVGAASTGTCSSGETRASRATRSPAG